MSTSNTAFVGANVYALVGLAVFGAILISLDKIIAVMGG